VTCAEIERARFRIDGAPVHIDYRRQFGVGGPSRAAAARRISRCMHAVSPRIGQGDEHCRLPQALLAQRLHTHLGEDARALGGGVERGHGRRATKPAPDAPKGRVRAVLTPRNNEEAAK
jgi:hypothetical protein